MRAAQPSLLTRHPVALSTATVAVFATAPLTPPAWATSPAGFTRAELAALTQAAICDTFDAVAPAAVRSVAVWEGTVPRWLPPHVTVVRQRGDGPGQRLTNALSDVMAVADGPAIVVGSRTPQVRAADLELDWTGYDAALGLSDDGGCWAIGLRQLDPEASRDLPVLGPSSGALQLDRLRSLGMRVAMLPTLRRIGGGPDATAAAAAVAAAAPGTRYARLHTRLVDRPCAPLMLFDAALAGAPVTAQVRAGERTRSVDLAVGRWQTMDAADELLVARCEGPVLDLACGPGRFVESLASRGVTALGVDVSRDAVAQTAARGGPVLLRSVEERLPAEGRWGTVLLADGNIGIGASPARLLARCRQLLRDGGLALVEVDAEDDVDELVSITLHSGGRSSTPVPWARIGAHALAARAGELGFVVTEEWRVGGRVFVALRLLG